MTLKSRGLGAPVGVYDTTGTSPHDDVSDTTSARENDAGLSHGNRTPTAAVDSPGFAGGASIAPTVTDARLALAEAVRALRDEQGLLWREIAERLHISRSYAQALHSDPDGSKARARKDSYRGVCDICGGFTTGSEGRGKYKRCAECSQAIQHMNRVWTCETIVARMRAFHAYTGRTPTATESQCRHGALAIRARLSPERLAEIDSVPDSLILPHIGAGVREFGSYSAAVRAAGFEPLKGGQPRHRGRRVERVAA